MPESRAGGRAAVVAGVGVALFLPLFMIVFPVAGLHQSGFNDPVALDAFVRRHFVLFALPYVDGLMMHVAGAIAVLNVHRRLTDRSPWMVAATIGGLAWMILDTAQNGLGLYASREIVAHASSAVSGP